MARDLTSSWDVFNTEATAPTVLEENLNPNMVQIVFSKNILQVKNNPDGAEHPIHQIQDTRAILEWDKIWINIQCVLFPLKSHVREGKTPLRGET